LGREHGMLEENHLVRSPTPGDHEIDLEGPHEVKTLTPCSASTSEAPLEGRPS
jgi:hypothetical protein